VSSSAISHQLKQAVLKRDWPVADSLLDRIEDKFLNVEDSISWGIFLAHSPHHRDVKKACEVLEKAANLFSQDIRVLTNLSEALLALKKVDRSLAVAKQAMELEPENVMVVLCSARAYLAKGLIEEAYSSFDTLNKLIPKNHPLKREVSTQVLRLAPHWRSVLRGKRLSLVRLNSTHFDFLFASRNNQSFQRHFNLFKATDKKTVLADIKKSEQKSPFDSGKVEWVVEVAGRPVGLANLAAYNHANRRAEIQIGFPDEKNYGFALEATLLVLEFAFSEMKLNKVFSYVYSDNEYSQHNTIHLGFVQEGCLREHVYDDKLGNYLDLFVNGLLKNEYYESSRIKRFKERFLMD